MKKFLLSLAALALGLTATAAEVTFDFSNAEAIKQMNSSVVIPTTNSSGTDVPNVVFTLDGVNISATKGTSEPRIWLNNGNYTYRVYKTGGVISISSEKTITSVTITDTAGAYTVNGNATKTWSGSANKVDFVVTTNCQITKIVVTVEGEGGGGTVTPPVDPDPVDPNPGDDTEAIILTATNFGYKTSYGAYDYTVNDIKFTSVGYLSSGNMQFNTNNANGKSSGIVVNANNSDYIVDYIDITYVSGNNGLNVYSYQGNGFGSLTPSQSPTIPADAVQVESALKASKKNISINAPSFAIFAAGSGAIVVSEVKVYLKEKSGESTFVAAPTISCANNTVTITNTVEGATVYYTTGDATPSNTSTEYTQPFSITETTTVNAIAYLNGNPSAVASVKCYYIPEGDLTVAQSVDLIKDGYTGVLRTKGIVVRTTNYNDNYGSITYYISDNGTTEGELQVYGGLNFNSTKFTAQSDIEVGATVVVEGNVKMYNGNPEFDQNNYLISYTAPDTLESYNPAFANETYNLVIGEDMTLDLGEEYPAEMIMVAQEEGIITIDDDTFKITADAIGTTVVDVEWDEDETFAAGSCTFTVNVTATPVVVETVIFDFSDPTTLSPAFEAPAAGEGIDIPNTLFTAGDVTLRVGQTAEGKNAPRLWTATGKYEGQVDFRMYTDELITIGVDEKEYHLVSIEFTKIDGSFAFDPSSGTLNKNGNTATWVPTSATEEEVMTLSDENISNVDFIASATTRISTVTVKYEEGAGILTGIEQISSDLEAAPVYYNLQGVRVANPEKGIYIVVKGSKSSKVLF